MGFSWPFFVRNLVLIWGPNPWQLELSTTSVGFYLHFEIWTLVAFFSLCTTEDQPFKNFVVNKNPHVPIWHLVLSCFYPYAFKWLCDLIKAHAIGLRRFNSCPALRWTDSAMFFMFFFGCSMPSEKKRDTVSLERSQAVVWVVGIHQTLTMLHHVFVESCCFFISILRVPLDLRRFFQWFSMYLPKTQEPPNFSEERFWGLRHVCCCWVANFGVGQPSGPFAHLWQQDVFGKKCNRHRRYTFHQGNCPSSIEGKNPTLGP